MVKKFEKITIIVLIMAVILCGCSDGRGNNDERKPYDYNYDCKVAVLEGDDGWVHYFVCEYEKGQSVPHYYVYDAYNLKYKELEGYEIEYVDENGKVLGSDYPTIIYMSLHGEYENDFNNINEYFEANKPLSKLTDEQRDSIKIEHMDKDMILNLYDEAISSEKLDNGYCWNYPGADMVVEETKDGYHWQIGYFLEHGHIMAVNIELIYDGNIYLSDLVSEGKADAEQIALGETVSNIENEIMANQLFDIDEDKYIEDDSVYLERLYDMIEDLEYSGY